MQLIEDVQILVKVSGDSQLCLEIISLLSPLLQYEDNFVKVICCESILKLVKENFKAGNRPDNQLIRNTFEMLSPLFKDEEKKARKLAPMLMVKLARFSDKSETQLMKDAFGLIASLLNDSSKRVVENAIDTISEFVGKVDLQYSRNAMEALLPLLQDNNWEIMSLVVERMTDFIKIGNEKSDLMLIKKVVDSIMSALQQQQDQGGYYRNKVLENLTEIVNFTGEVTLAKETIQSFILFFADSQIRDGIKKGITKIIQVNGHSAEIIQTLTPLLKNEKSDVRIIVSSTLVEIANGETQPLIKSLLPLLKDPESAVRVATLQNITGLMNLNADGQISKEVMENFVPFLQDSDKALRLSASSNIIQILASSNDDQLVKETLNLVSPVFQDSNSDVARNAVEVLKSQLPKLLLIQPDSFAKHLTHSSKDVRDTVLSYLLPCLQKYVDSFQKFDLLNQYPTSDLTVEVILQKLFEENNSSSEALTNQIKICLGSPEQLKSLLLSEINKIEAMKGPQIIELAIVIIGQEKAPTDDSDRKKLIELAKEILPIQLKYLNEDGLVWINKNCERLLSLSPETKLFYKKIYHRLLEDGEITSLEEELLIKFINQGLTTSLTRHGEIIFEGKRYKLKGEEIELVLEKIAKTIIEQQQDILATQYKEHEPIFEISVVNGGMKQAAADIKETRSIVDSRHVLQTESWLITRLKSLKFNSEIVLLEQRSAFGDHVVYHFNQQQLWKFYPGESPVLQKIFGSYIYGEAYQGEVTELADKAGQKYLEDKGITKRGRIQIEGKLKSKQIYFQQELLKQGNEDRNSAVEEELAKKLDNNRVVFNAKLKSFNLKEAEKSLIEDYYEGFISAFSSVYSSSLAVASGKLSIDDGKDFFSPVNIFIQLTSLAPFGIGEILSEGLEAARSHIKSTVIKNEAKFVKNIAIDAVELSDLVAKIAVEIVSKKEQQKRILEVKENDGELNDGLINKVRNLVMEKIEKLTEKFPKMKNLFEKEIETSPAFRLGESDANKIIKHFIDLKRSQPDLRMKFEEKQRKFVGVIIGENKNGDGIKKITPLPTSPKEIKPDQGQGQGKTACCEIF